MSELQRPYSRLIAAAATLLVIATPVVLAVTTLTPLESAPRAGRAPVMEETAPATEPSVDNAEPSSDQQREGRRNRRNRDRDQGQDEATESMITTPIP